MKRQSVSAIVALVLTFAGTQATGYNLVEFPICTNDANQINPAINGSIIVWQDYRNGNWDIYGYDLSTQTEFPICVNSADQINPDISGDIVVWEDHRYDSTYQGFYCSIYGYKLSTRTEFLVYHMNSHQLDPAIDGNFIVWVEHYPTPWRINGYSLSGHTKFLIWEDEYFYHPAISGSSIVWYAYGNSNKIRGYDLYNRMFLPTIDVADTLIYEGYPNISGSIVVYEHRKSLYPIGERYMICYTDYSSQCGGSFGVPYPCSRCITYNDPNWCQSNYCNYAEGTDPDISGNIIVWTRWWDSNNCLSYGHDIYGYDISTKIWFPICKIGQWHENPAIDGNVVVWQDHRNGNWDIYGARFEPFCLEKPEMDFNGDCKVNFADFALFAQSWLDCNLVPQSACWE